MFKNALGFQLHGTLKSLPLAVALALCAGPASTAFAQEAEICGPPVIKIPVFYATDRKQLGSNKDETDCQLGPLKVGTATTILPAEMEWLSKGNLRADLAGAGWQLDNQLATVKPYIEIRGYVAEPPEKVLVNLKEGADFWSKLTEQLSKSAIKSVYVYIHGFASSGHNSLYSAGILSSRVEAPVIVFTWPSEGTVGLKPFKLLGKKRVRARFQRDKAMIDREEVMADLTSFLAELQSKVPIGTQINLVAHSLGNRLMARYFCTQASQRFARVYFIAADVDKDMFLSALEGLKTRSDYTAVFENPDDRVLKISGANNLLSGKIAPKLGASKFSVPDIEFINYRQVAAPASFDYLSVKHYLPFEQFGSIVRTGKPYNGSSNDSELILVRQSTIERLNK